jgi:molecular chaperone DnaJ
MATAVTDLYATLGVAPTASAEEIKRAYRKLARQYHPDRNPGDADAEARFKEVQAAYDTLSDPQQRAEYDAARNAPRATARPRAEGAGFGAINLDDLFGDVFDRGARRSSRRPRIGDDIEVEVAVSFDEAFHGAVKQVPVSLEAECRSCGGSGGRLGAGAKACPQCGGRGIVGDTSGFFSLAQTCPRCGGEGRVPAEPCPDCGGSGRERITTRYSVEIPAGATDGMRIRLPGKGDAGEDGGAAGDLYVRTRVAGSPIFKRRGADLTVEVPVSFPEATLGATVEVPTPDGRVSLKVPPGSQEGRQLRIRGRGMPKLHGGGRGDLIGRLHVDVPKKLTPEQRQAVERLAAVLDDDPRAQLRESARTRG